MFQKYYQIAKKLFFILVNNPIFFFKRIFFELKYLFLVPKLPIINKKIRGVYFEFDFTLSPQVKKMYAGNYQPIITETLEKYLRSGDTFIDAGANIGFFTAIAAGLVGNQGQVHSFEPVSEYFNRLAKLAKNNGQYRIYANQCAVGEQEISAKIYVGSPPNIGNSSLMQPYFKEADMSKVKIVDVPVRRLDKYIEEKGLKNIKLIKIDVEGFEFFVLKGLSGYLEKCAKRGAGPVIICEVFPALYASLGYKAEDIFTYMKNFSYFPFEILNSNKRIVDGKRKLGDIIFKLQRT